MDKKVWIITGASKGLGYAFTKAALADGNIVIAAARHVNTMEGLKDKYRELLWPIRLDITDRENTFRVVSEVAAKYGHIDVLVSNAGHLHKSVFEDTSLSLSGCFSH